MGKCGKTEPDPYLPKEMMLEVIGSSIVEDATPKFTLEWINKDIQDQVLEDSNNIPNKAVLLVYTDRAWSGAIQDSGFDTRSVQGSSSMRISFVCGPDGIYSLNVQDVKRTGIGFEWATQREAENSFRGLGDPALLVLAVIQDGKLLDSQSTTAEYGVVGLTGICQPAYAQGSKSRKSERCHVYLCY